MSIIRITKEFQFEMAHALLGHDGPCKNIHGHSYKLDVTVKGKVKQNTTDPDEGMVVDFTII
jgi:6-pyruvoyltetrahydropterin/6-carboxytetrahydropterin synthase